MFSKLENAKKKKNEKEMQIKEEEEQNKTLRKRSIFKKKKKKKKAEKLVIQWQSNQSQLNSSFDDEDWKKWNDQFIRFSDCFNHFLFKTFN